MVKNTTGGKRSKCLARKNETQYVSKLRISDSCYEKYAIVTKLYGGSVCSVFCDDNITRNAIIRGKFSGKNKRNHIIGPGTILLVGLRDWSSHSTLETCDVLEVYSLYELDLLKQRPDFHFDLLNNSFTHNNNDAFHFSTFIEIHTDTHTDTHTHNDIIQELTDEDIYDI